MDNFLFSVTGRGNDLFSCFLEKISRKLTGQRQGHAPRKNIRIGT